MAVGTDPVIESFAVRDYHRRRVAPRLSAIHNIDLRFRIIRLAWETTDPDVNYNPSRARDHYVTWHDLRKSTTFGSYFRSILAVSVSEVGHSTVGPLASVGPQYRQKIFNSLYLYFFNIFVDIVSWPTSFFGNQLLTFRNQSKHTSSSS